MEVQKLTRPQVLALTPVEKVEYQKALNLARVHKYRTQNQEKARQYNKEYKIKYCNRSEENKARCKETNLRNVKAFRERQKATKQTKTKALNTITDAIKARKARNEVKQLKADAVNKDVKNILNDIIDAVPVIVAKKQNKQRVYNTRQRQKLKAEGKEIPPLLMPKRRGRKPKAT
jgi:hypothetical protein